MTLAGNSAVDTVRHRSGLGLLFRDITARTDEIDRAQQAAFRKILQQGDIFNTLDLRPGRPLQPSGLLIAFSVQHGASSAVDQIGKERSHAPDEHRRAGKQWAKGINIAEVGIVAGIDRAKQAFVLDALAETQLLAIATAFGATRPAAGLHTLNDVF